MMFSLQGKRIWVAGHRGMVGSALVRKLLTLDCETLAVGRETVDLTRNDAVGSFVRDTRPDVIILAAAKVGGILANSQYPADFLYQNLLIQNAVIGAAHDNDVQRLLFIGSSCIYPRLAPQPIDEDALLTGPLEETNEPYAIAKIAGIKLVEALRRQYGRDYISAMPTNLYGPGDNFDLSSSHVLPALMRKVHEARQSGSPTVTLWGSGTPRREFLHVDDCANALVFMLERYSGEGHLNVGSGVDLSILELAQLVCRIIGYTGEIILDRSKPDGTPRKLMNVERLRQLGWQSAIPLEQGIEDTYKWFLDNGDVVS